MKMSKLKDLPKPYDCDEKKRIRSEDRIRQVFITSKQLLKTLIESTYQNDPKSQFEIQSSSFLLD